MYPGFAHGFEHRLANAVGVALQAFVVRRFQLQQFARPGAGQQLIEQVLVVAVGSQRRLGISRRPTQTSTGILGRTPRRLWDTRFAPPRTCFMNWTAWVSWSPSF